MNIQADDDSYWTDSSVKDQVKRQMIFNGDDNNAAIERFKSRSNPFVENMLSSSTVKSARFRANDEPTKPIVVNNPTPTNIIPTETRRTIEPTSLSARFNPSPVPSPSTITNKTPQPFSTNNFYDQKKNFVPTSNVDRVRLVLKDLEKNNGKIEGFRKYDEKAELLKEALLINTPNVIVPVLMFLENSLSRSLFHELIKEHPAAVTNYINMAKLRFESDYHIALLKQFGRNENVAMIRLGQASRVNDLKNKMSILQQAEIDLASHPWWHLQVAEQCQQIRKQQEFQSLVDSSSTGLIRTALETYKTIYEYEFRRQKQMKTVDKTVFDRSREFEGLLRISPQMIMCGKLTVIMRCSLPGFYDDFIHQAIHQGVFGKKYVIAPEYLADMMNNLTLYHNEPAEKANEKTARFLNMINEPEKRIYFAEKLKNYQVAIETIVNVLRDRSLLETLRKRIPNDHPAYLMATSLLDGVKWKN